MRAVIRQQNKSSRWCGHALKPGSTSTATKTRYLQNQEIHHRKENFLDEYRKMLKLFDVEYDEQYIFRELI